MSTLDILLSKIIAHWKRDWWYMNFVGTAENYCCANMFSLISYSLILTHSTFSCNSADLIFFFDLQSGNAQWNVTPTLKFTYSIPVAQLVFNACAKTKKNVHTKQENIYSMLIYISLYILCGLKKKWKAMGFHCLFFWSSN